MESRPTSSEERGRLAGKVAIVTGGGHLQDAGMGTGSAISALFARQGAAVAVVDRDAALAASTVRLIKKEGNRARVVVADVTSSADCASAVSETVDAFGRIDIIVNNVGIASRGGPVTLAEEEWRRVFDVNLTSAFLMSKHVLPIMERQGSGAVVNISSTAAEWGIGAAAYTASKYALNSLTREYRFSARPSRHSSQCHRAGPHPHTDGEPDVLGREIAGEAQRGPPACLPARRGRHARGRGDGCSLPRQ